MKNKYIRICRKRTEHRIMKRTIAIALAVVLGISGQTMIGHCVTEQEKATLEKGIDVSAYNGTVDFEKVKKQGYTYVMIRIGAGKETTDPCFAQNYGDAGSAGLKRGVYYYSYATTVKEATAEAQRCISLIDKRNLECPVTFDIEEKKAFETGKENVTAMTVAFCDTIAKAGYTPMVYASLNHLNDYFDSNTISKYKLWIANYDVDYPNYAYPYAMWQYTIGSVSGANTGAGECDENYIYNDFVPASTISVDQTKMALEIGEGRVSTGALQAVVGEENASNKHVNWSSKDEKVVTVDQKGQVVAVGNGTTDIIASTVNGVQAKCTVTVTTPATAIKIGNESLTIGKKENFNLKPVLTPSTSTDQTHYKSSNEKIVRVEKDGSLTGLKKGSATITATTDSGVTTTVTVTVKKAPWRIYHNKWFKTIKVGESYDMGCRIPKNSASNKISYYSRNKYRVSVSKKGVVKAHAAGWCILRATTYNNKRTWTLVHVTQ